MEKTPIFATIITGLVISLVVLFFDRSFASNNPFEQQAFNAYYGKWSEENGKLILFLHGIDQRKIIGIVKRGSVVMDISGEIRNGVLTGVFGSGEDKFKFSAMASEDVMEFEAGTFTAKLTRQKGKSFIGVYEKKDFAMEIQESDGAEVARYLGVSSSCVNRFISLGRKPDAGFNIDA